MAGRAVRGTMAEWPPWPRLGPQAQPLWLQVYAPPKKKFPWEEPRVSGLKRNRGLERSLERTRGLERSLDSRRRRERESPLDSGRRRETESRLWTRDEGERERVASGLGTKERERESPLVSG
ncbi:hypothetical protein DPX16_7662 [Anabarilius grahami]|uniref:Uncharacterized protein n=1 Tax=Anabarilius grahami TaxID=495550 RepID=A0A3N0YRA3_ANAGA|nr:hypothetical protein DPX16_7662 [Anabarilius grahami]